MRDLPLSKRPERAILDSQPPGIGGMSVNISTGVTMKTLTSTALGAVFLAAIAAPSQAQNIVVWRAIIGIAQAGSVVGGITGGGQPWSTREGEALVELDSGFVVFEVRGLVLAGAIRSGRRVRCTRSKERSSADLVRPVRPSLILRLCH